MYKTVNILAKGTGWDEIRNRKPSQDEETWGVNDSFLRVKCDKTFHMHDLNVFAEQASSKSSTKLVTEWSKDYPDMEIFTTVPYNKIKNIVLYPLDDIVKHFGICYFTCTIDYMIAYALWKGVETLNYYGVNMSVKEEYKEQKPGVEFWTGMALGMGVKVGIQYPHTSLLKTKDDKLYGYLFEQWRPDDKNTYSLIT